jgi:hypothetical protein
VRPRKLNGGTEKQKDFVKGSRGAKVKTSSKTTGSGFFLRQAAVQFLSIATTKSVQHFLVSLLANFF